MKKEKEFAYCIGFYWVYEPGRRVGGYTFLNTEIHNGTLTEAKRLLKMAKSSSPNTKFKIFKLVELKERCKSVKTENEKNVSRLCDEAAGC